MRRRIFTFCTLLATVLLFSRLPCPAQVMHREGWHGFEFQLSDDWIRLPGNPQEPWICGHYYLDEILMYDLVDQSGVHRQRRDTPELQVVVLPADHERNDAEKKSSASGKAPRDYPAFLARTFSDIEFEIRSTSSRKIGSNEVLALETEIPKTNYAGKKVLLARIYPLPGAQVILQFKLVEKVLSKIELDIHKVFNSFRAVERCPSDEAPPRLIDMPDESVLRKMSLAERAEVRLRVEESVQEWFMASLPADWSVDREKDPVLVSKGDRKFCRMAMSHYKATLKWLESNFGFIGEDEYVRRPFLVVFPDSSEMSIYDVRRQERRALLLIAAPAPRNNYVGNNLGYVSTGLVRLWFSDKDLDLFLAMPGWLKHGMHGLFRETASKGNKIDFQGFKENARTHNLVVRRIKDKTAASPKSLILATVQQFKDSPTLTNEAGALLYFLMEGRKPLKKKFKNLPERYLRALLDAVDQARGVVDEEVVSHDDFAGEPAATRGEVWEKRRQSINETVHEKVFAGWTVKDWESLNRIYRESFN